MPNKKRIDTIRSSFQRFKNMHYLHSKILSKKAKKGTIGSIVSPFSPPMICLAENLLDYNDS